MHTCLYAHKQAYLFAFVLQRKTGISDNFYFGIKWKFSSVYVQVDDNVYINTISNFSYRNSLSRDNGKLYFEYLKIFSVPENHLPLQGAKNTSEVGIFLMGTESKKAKKKGRRM